MKYFAYGSNMNPAVLAKKRIEFADRQSATLDGYLLRFNKRSLRQLLPQNIGFANVVPTPGRHVEGVLYDILEESLARLDDSERVPEHYERIAVVVTTASGVVNCFTYRARPDKTATGLIPSRNYVSHILAAGSLLSEAYRKWLDDHETYADECAACHKTAEVLFVKEEGLMYVMCPPCLEARRIWGDARGRRFSVLDTEAVMLHLRKSGSGYDSIPALIDDAVRLGLIEPADGETGERHG
jgi:gamma-glutamylcyclotransferase (GGCT)/AIG2-like uncharacterized protein YtfP